MSTTTTTTTSSIHATMTIVPKPQARPRFGSMPAHSGGRAGSGRKVVMSDPTKAYKQQLLRLFLSDIGPDQRALLPLQGAVHMTAEFIFARPKSHYRAASLSASNTASSTSHKRRKRSTTSSTQPRLTKRAADMFAQHVCKPDIDNLAKSTMDAINGVAYTDDAQVTCGSFSKRWAASPDEPSHIVLTLTGQPNATRATSTQASSASSCPSPTILQALIPSLR